MHLVKMSHLIGTMRDMFQIGKNGTTLLSGSLEPTSSEGVDGDFFFQSGSTPGYYQKIAGEWVVQGSGYAQATRIITAGNVIADATDSVIIINKTVGSPTTVELPFGPPGPKYFTIKDGKGDANTNNITVSVESGGLIDDQTTFVLNTIRESLTVLWVEDRYYVV